jgi:hypothetical protein
MTLDQANDELVRHRNAALTGYGNKLLAAGSDVDDQEFRTKMVSYARDLERWRRDAMDHIRQVIKAAAERHGATIN